MEKKVVFDIGMHTGQDTQTYLREGYKVIAVEASPIMVEKCRKKFKKYIDNGLLIIENVGIADKNTTMPFYINHTTSEWSSFDQALGTRRNTAYEVVDIPCTTTTDLFKKHGIPYFLKVDIEGYDYYCINELPEKTASQRIKYISCEASDVSLIDTLYRKGYTKFKVIHQSNDFKPINLAKERMAYFPWFLFFYSSVRLRLQKVFTFDYPYSSSGPMPEKSKGEWLTYEEARKQYVAFYQGEKLIPLNNKSWFDFHATY